MHISRLIFEKFFNRKAKQLLFSIPLDRTDENGVDFWSDKQIPHPIEFDLSNDLHKNFLILCAQLIANVNQIEIPEKTDYSEALSSLNIPEFCPKSDKIIITDPLVTLTGETTEGFEEQNIQSVGLKQLKYCRDNENHLQFVYILTVSLSFLSKSMINSIKNKQNLRAEMYDIRRTPICEVNRIYNKIIDCFGSTLSTASAMVNIIYEIQF